jgi:hypothetical protein
MVWSCHGIGWQGLGNATAWETWHRMEHLWYGWQIAASGGHLVANWGDKWVRNCL